MGRNSLCVVFIVWLNPSHYSYYCTRGNVSTMEMGTVKDWTVPCIRTHLSSCVPGVNEHSRLYESDAKTVMQQCFRSQLISFLPCDRRKLGTPLYTIVNIISRTAWTFPVITYDVTVVIHFLLIYVDYGFTRFSFKCLCYVFIYIRIYK